MIPVLDKDSFNSGTYFSPLLELISLHFLCFDRCVTIPSTLVTVGWPLVFPLHLRILFVVVADRGNVCPVLAHLRVAFTRDAKEVARTILARL